MQEFGIDSKIYFGENALEQLEKLQGKTACIITDKTMVNIKAVDKIESILINKQIKYTVISDIKPDPTVEVIAEGIKVFLKELPEIVIALGGGSVIDAAKGILYSLWKMKKKEGAFFKKPTFVAIPSTSGTGSEVTAFTVITVGNGKLALVDEWMTPDIAIVDPFFTKTVPPSITADTGMDVLCHALEAYVSTKASDYTDALCEKVVKLIMEHLLDAYQDGSNMLAREKVHNASCMAGLAFTNASLGITHSLAHALGGVFHIPHGRANAMLMPYVIEYNAQHSQEAAKRYGYLANLLGLPAEDETVGWKNLILIINQLRTLMNMPQRISELEIDHAEYEAQLETMATLAIADNCTPTNPYQPTKEDLKKLYLTAYGQV
ncbi:1-propanol dehydrogenase PduQ [Vagococcus sp.]|uniref:1-propanol dehydrogenase PduQ n=1 Tax=Vagococcus sp. TaxID=1933889 RepID=UPI003F9B9319